MLKPWIQASLLILVALLVTGCHEREDTAKKAPPEKSSACDSVSEDQGRPILPQEGVTIIPLLGAAEHANLARDLIEREFDIPVRVTKERALPPESCREDTGQLQAENSLGPVVPAGPERQATITITTDDLRSDQFAWQFAAFDASNRVGIISTSRLGGSGILGPNEEKLRKRLASLVLKYVLVLYNDAPTDQEVGSSLLSFNYSLAHLDAKDSDACPYRKRVRAQRGVIRCGPQSDSNTSDGFVAAGNGICAKYRPREDEINNLPHDTAPQRAQIFGQYHKLMVGIVGELEAIDPPPDSGESFEELLGRYRMLSRANREVAELYRTGRVNEVEDRFGPMRGAGEASDDIADDLGLVDCIG